MFLTIILDEFLINFALVPLTSYVGKKTFFALCPQVKSNRGKKFFYSYKKEVTPIFLLISYFRIDFLREKGREALILDFRIYGTHARLLRIFLEYTGTVYMGTYCNAKTLKRSTIQCLLLFGQTCTQPEKLLSNLLNCSVPTYYPTYQTCQPTSLPTY